MPKAPPQRLIRCREDHSYSLDVFLSVIASGSGGTDARIFTASVRDFFDLVMHNSLLKSREQHLAVIELQSQIPLILAGRTKPLKFLRSLLSRLSRRSHDNPDVHVSP